MVDLLILMLIAAARQAKAKAAETPGSRKAFTLGNKCSTFLWEAEEAGYEAGYYTD